MFSDTPYILTEMPTNSATAIHINAVIFLFMKNPSSMQFYEKFHVLELKIKKKVKNIDYIIINNRIDCGIFIIF